MAVHRDSWLDVLRGLAVLFVILAHIEFRGSSVPAQVSAAFEGFAIIGGRAGVDLFFVLSGFLVSGLLFKEWEQTGTVRPGRFLIRRGFKIYPAFWVALAFIVSVRIWKGHGVPVDRLIGELLFLQNYVGRLSDPHWTLAVEEHFYLLLAALFMWHSRHRPGREHAADGAWVVKLFVFLAVGCLLARTLAFYMYPGWNEPVLMMTHARIDGLFLGVLLAMGCRNHGWHARLQAKLGLPACFLLAVFAWWLVYAGLKADQPWASFAGMDLTGGAAALLLLAGVGRPELGSFFAFRWLSGVGRHSYSIYLWHMPWLRFLQPYLEKLIPGQKRWWITAVLGVAGSLALGRLMAAVVEGPALKLRDRWFPAPAKPSLTVAPAV
ncbi:acyltransferase family protein [Prosthecobacter sp.]|uniref:acyltransferase family protein n=1 Tax=Prosthecobacter sp. TaxID=1965333 RepID=UPI003783D80D